jgi:predicted phage baseplate assembly protein
MVLFDGGTGSASALAVVASVSDVLWAVPYPVLPGASAPNPPDIAVTHTQLTLTLAPSDVAVLFTAQEANTVGSVTVRYSFKDVGQIIAVPAPTLPSLPAVVTVPVSYTPPDGGAIAFLEDATGAGLLVMVSAAGSGQVTLTGAGTPPATITTPLDVVPVSRGTTVTNEVLGSGNAALINQSFTLSKAPLTYLASGSGPVAALAVYVDGVEWRQVPSFYGQAASARVFVVSRSPDQAVTTVTFGDGVNGARLTSGTGNVVATYRYGSGAASPPAGRLTTISQPQPNLAAIQNPVAVSGGADPQAADDVRANAPASVFTFGRAISAVDYEVVASQAPGVSRVGAYWTFDGTEQRTLVTVYVGDDQAAVAAASAALAGADDPNRPVSVRGATPIELELSCTLVVAADRQVTAVVAAAAAAISDSADGLFSPARMGIGQRLYRSAVDAALMVPGVVAVHDLTVTRPGRVFPRVFLDIFRFDQVLGEFFDPGEGSFFDLRPGHVSIVGVSAGG